MVTQKAIVRLQGVGSAHCTYSSLYSLTLDEVENHLGNLSKPLGSMNLDELLTTVWTAEAIDHSGGDGFSLSHDLGKKTVEEVCREIQHGLAFGEITLEDFLAQAGVVVESNGGSRLPNSEWIRQQMLPQQHQADCAMPIFNQQVGDSAYLDMSISPSTLMMGTGRKRLALGEMVEMTVERQQKRMIKNRESAARSRARKQAHTLEMEIKLSRLEEENKRLRRTEPNSQWIQHQMLPQHQTYCAMPIFNQHVGDSAYLDMSISPSTLMMGTGRKRLALGEMVEKTVEWRQKRMIKNRESAARSRARKQAHTLALEISISRLEEENKRLRRTEESENVLPSAPPPELKYQLRQTSSAPW